MLLEIDDWRTAGDLQYRFNKCFPNLTLLLFHASDHSRTQAALPSSLTLEKIRASHQPGVLPIKSWFTCAQVERLLRDQYGLKARVVREDGQVPKNSSITLQEFNSLAPNTAPHVQPASEETELIEGWRTW